MSKILPSQKFGHVDRSQTESYDSRAVKRYRLDGWGLGVGGWELGVSWLGS
jgi:hypothetical protein